MASAPPLGSPRLRRLATEARATGAQETFERCELCGRPVPDDHRHVLNLKTRSLMCACRTCALLFDKRGAASGRLRLVPDRRLALEDFALDDATWDGLRIPVEMAFFFLDGAGGRVAAAYPGPMGATESRLELTTWGELAAANPILATLEPDVEALLVNRARGARRSWIVPVEDPYRLVAIIRTRWRGLTGGAEVWSAIADFFADLDRRARPFRRDTVPSIATQTGVRHECRTAP